MRKPVLTSFGVLIGALGLALATMALFRLGAQARKTAPAYSQAAVINGTTFPIHFRDAFSREIVVPAAPKRVISLAPSVTEILFALGVDDRLVADTEYCIHPPAAKLKEKVGGISSPNLEKMLALRPDLILGSGLTSQEVSAQIDHVGLRAVYFRHTDIASVYRDIVSIATLLGERPRGEKLVSDMRTRVDKLTARLKALPPGPRPKVLLLLRIDGLYSAGKGSFPHEIIELAGGENVAAHAASMWPQMSMETVLQANPDVILVALGKGKVEGDFLHKTWQQMRVDPRWKQIKAVANNRLVLVEDDLLTIPGPRLVDSLELVAEGLHPELAQPKK